MSPSEAIKVVHNMNAGKYTDAAHDVISLSNAADRMTALLTCALLNVAAELAAIKDLMPANFPRG